MGKKFAAFNAQGNITGFYDSVDSPVPDGITNVVEISAAEWAEMMNAQSRGMRIVINEHGKPAALDPLPPTRAESAELKRAQRDMALKATDWLVARHQDEKLIGDGSTLTAAQFATLVKYRQALRDISEADRWPDVDLPAAPDFVTAIG
ncbi:phage tail protein [Burkholderia cepacia]|uniref:Phage tail protein n=1 Tax=Burkholderia cepacia TaxID=292 RepID=A0A2S8HWF3_BURCE|nr:phage tail assembly chaperone [Burkholderia cepacia]PQP06853.1 phage tail protein [Burkholderia cepacia]HDR9512195.1 tail fiber assembly protein [Burkholderia cepacia]